ncbi:MAG: ATP-binding cassette domain-containing protein [Ferruginibacter sp.]
MNIIESLNVSFSYNDAAVLSYPDFKCSVEAPLVIMGKSGSGKTTLLHILAGILRASGGEVSINSIKLNALSPGQLDQFRGRNIGIVYQRAHFMASLSVLDNILLSQYFSGQPLKPTKARDIARQLNIEQLLDKKTMQISQGEQQRVSIARALLPEPKVLLTDEPTSSLDDDSCLSVVHLLKEQSYRVGSALIIVTHDERVKKHFSNTIYLR